VGVRNGLLFSLVHLKWLSVVRLEKLESESGYLLQEIGILVNLVHSLLRVIYCKANKLITLRDAYGFERARFRL
jgi:hypothetical protein